MFLFTAVTVGAAGAAGAAGVAVALRRQTSLVRADGKHFHSLSGLTRGFQFREVRARKPRARSQSPASQEDVLHSRLRARSSSPTGTGRTARTWKEYAGRIRGGDGYHLGDLARGRLRSLRARRLRARHSEVCARDEAGLPAPARVAGASRDRTQDFKDLRSRHREESLASAPKRKELRDLVANPRPVELQQLLKEGASAARARKAPQHEVFCPGAVHSAAPRCGKNSAAIRCGKSLSCGQSSISNFLRGRARPAGAANVEGKLCHICRQWFCPDCRPHLLQPQSVALLVGEASLGRLGPIKSCISCHRLVDTLRWQHKSGLGTGLVEAQQELAAAYRGLHEHQTKFLEALGELEQALRDAYELEDAKLLDSIAHEEFTEIFQEGCQQTESAHKYLDLDREILDNIQVHSPSDQRVKEQMVAHFRMFREASTARLHAAERSVKGFVERNRRGRAVDESV